eukprot:Nk52_evm24s234 gene=Nk52_evmTU24s234
MRANHRAPPSDDRTGMSSMETAGDSAEGFASASEERGAAAISVPERRDLLIGDDGAGSVRRISSMLQYRPMSTLSMDDDPLLGEEDVAAGSGLAQLDGAGNSNGDSFGSGDLLFGDMFRLFDSTGSQRDRIINYGMGALTFFSVTATLALSIVRAISTNPIHIFMGFAVFAVSGTNLILVNWYRRGDLDPRFRKVIGYAAISVLILCVAANMYFWEVGAPTNS